MRTLYETCNLLEMANISKKTTKLPVNIWIQCEMTTQHNKPRIKFQNNYANKFETDDLVPLSIEDNPTILANNVKLNISSKDLQKVIDWVVKNKILLLKLWKLTISFDEFLVKMKK